MTHRPLEIVLFREEREADPYRTEFEKAGFTPFFVPILQTSYEPSLGWTDVSGSERPHAVVVTSRRSLVAIGQDIRLLGRVREEWGHLPWFAVGPATARAAERLGLNVHPSTPGTSTMLAEPIIQSGARRVAFLTGNPHREDLENALLAQGVDVHTTILYTMTIRPVAELPIAAGWAVVFSPRGAQAVHERLKASAGLRRAAIGPTTAAAMEALGLRVDAVADHPEPESLINAVHDAQE